MHPSKRYKMKIFSHCCEGIMKPFPPKEFAFKHKNVSISLSDVLFPSFYLEFWVGKMRKLSNTRLLSQLDIKLP